MNRDVKTVIDWARHATIDGAGAPSRVLAALDRLTERKRLRKTIAAGRMKPSRAQKKAARASTRPLVAARENGWCAVRALGGCRGRLVWDHFWGRGKVPPGVEREWMLCEEHDHQKTDGIPDRAHWLMLYAMHCRFYGYDDEARKAEAMRDLELAQHPEHERTGTR